MLGKLWRLGRRGHKSKSQHRVGPFTSSFLYTLPSTLRLGNSLARFVARLLSLLSLLSGLVPTDDVP